METVSFLRKEEGQSFIELIVASGIFLIIVGGIAYVILTTYVLNEEARDRTQALLIAQEGLEAARSIRDNNFGALRGGDHGVTLSPDKKWVFSGTSDLVQNKFTRTVAIADLAAERKKITSRVSWNFRGGSGRNVELVTFLSNWQMTLPGGMLVYGDGGTTSDVIRYRILDADNGTWGPVLAAADVNIATTNRALRMARVYASPTRNEKILISRHYNVAMQMQFIYAQVFNGSSWSNVVLLSFLDSNAFLDVRNVDGTYLENGDFMTVYSDNTTTPKFRVWNGTSWSSQIATQNTGGIPTYIVARARPGTNEVMVAVFGQQRDTNTEYFNGGSYTSANWTLHAQHARNTPVTTKQFIDFEWSANSPVRGALIYSDAANDIAMNIKIWTADGAGGGSWSGTANTANQAARLGAMRASSRFGANEVVACDKDAAGTPHIICSRSNFTPSWDPVNQQIASATDNGIQRSFDIGFESLSGDLALGVYSDTAATPKLKKYNAGTNTWDASATSLNSVGSTLETVTIIPKEDSDDMMVLLANTVQDLYSIVWDGANDTVYTIPAGKAFSAHGTNGSADEEFWFDFAWDRF